MQTLIFQYSFYRWIQSQATPLSNTIEKKKRKHANPKYIFSLIICDKYLIQQQQHQLVREPPARLFVPKFHHRDSNDGNQAKITTSIPRHHWGSSPRIIKPAKAAMIIIRRDIPILSAALQYNPFPRRKSISLSPSTLYIPPYLRLSIES